MTQNDELWIAEEAYREAVAREWIAQRITWEKRLRAVHEEAAQRAELAKAS